MRTLINCIMSALVWLVDWADDDDDDDTDRRYRNYHDF